LSRVDPPFENGDPVLGPCSVARHRPRAQASENRVGVRGHVLVRPEVEREAHRAAIALTEERLDVLVEADLLVGSGHLGLLLGWLRWLLGERRDSGAGGG